MIFITGGGNFHLILYKSYNSRRIIRSPLAADTHFLADYADAAILLHQYIQRITGNQLPGTLLTDFKSIFYVISKGSTALENILMIDLRATNEAYDGETLDNLGWIRFEYNIAYTLTKVANSELMKHFMDNGKKN